MKAQLSTEERLSILNQMTESPEAYAFYLQAMETRSGLSIAPSTSSDEFHRLLDEAIRLDPLFARAYAAKAFAYSFDPAYERLTLELADKARSAQRDFNIAVGLTQIDSMDVSILAQLLQKMRLSGLQDESGMIRQKFEQILDGSPPSTIEPVTRARAYIGLGDDAMALKQIELAADQIESGTKLRFERSVIQNIYNDPVLERPEFIAVRKRIGYVAPGSVDTQ